MSPARLKIAIITVTVSVLSVPAWAAEGKTLGIPDPIWKTVNLILFIAALGWWIGRPLARFLEERRLKIQNDLAEAQEKLKRAEALQGQVAERLAAVERELEEVKERAEREGKAEADRILAEASREEERFLKRVEEEIARRTAETRAQLARDTAELTVQMARELLEREVTDADRKRILARNLKALEGLEGRP